MAVLLFKIDSGVRFNLGQLLFDQVIDARNGNKGWKELILPNLIYDDDVGLSSDVDTTGLTIVFLENELSLIHDQRKILTTRDAQITGFLSTLRKDVHDMESPDCVVATSSESASSFSLSNESVSF
nr:uncharacterized protein LOC109169177 [Ipomoea trifida]